MTLSTKPGEIYEMSKRINNELYSKRKKKYEGPKEDGVMLWIMPLEMWVLETGRQKVRTDMNGGES